MHSVLSKEARINLFLLGAIPSLFSANPLLTIYVILAFVWILRMNWMPRQPAVFVYGLVYQWLQSAIRVFQANLAGLPLNTFDQSNHAETAVYLTITGVLLISRMLAKWCRRYTFDHARLVAAFRSIAIGRAFQVHLLFLALAPLFSALKIGGLSQFILPIEQLHWFAFCLLALAVLHRQQGFGYLIVAFSIEFIFGLTGFFSGFKTVIIYLVIAVLSVMTVLKIRHLAFLALTAALLIGLGLFWTAIKVEYRMFLSGGERSQLIVVSKTDQISYLLRAVRNTDKIDWNEAADRMLDRLQYTRMFQLALDHVPANTAHAQGACWQSAVRHVLMPRLLFPNKAALDDSQHAAAYTGITWAGAAEGSSISLGYIAESYVDFGVPGMFIPILILSLGFGYLYSRVVKQAADTDLIALHYVGIILIFIPFSLIETSPSKLLGGILLRFLMYHHVIHPVLYPRLWRFIAPKNP